MLNDTFGMFNRMFEDDFSRIFSELSKTAVEGTGPRCTAYVSYPTPQFPPVDVEIDEETKDLYFTFALAGYTSDEISLKFEGDYLELSSEIIHKEKDSKINLKKGIKKTSFSYKYIVPMSKYESEKVEAEFKDGLLKIHVPARESMKPKQVQIKLT